jgi:hypothetical protein
MKANHLTQGQERRVMYLENKDGLLDGVQARIGWVTFSKSGRTVYYRGRSLKAIGGRGVRGNFIDVESGEEFWVSGIKRRGSNTHVNDATPVVVDDDAKAATARLSFVVR